MLKPYKFVIRDLVAPASLPALAFRGTAIPACALGFSSWHNHFRLRFCSAGIPAGACFSWHSQAWLCFWVSLRRGAAPAAGGRPISAQSKPFVISNPPEAGEARLSRPVRFTGVRYGFASHVLCAMNLFLLLFCHPDRRGGVFCRLGVEGSWQRLALLRFPVATSHGAPSHGTNLPRPHRPD